MTFFDASTWVIPVIIAITFHEAAHGFVALLCGDETAWRLGRVSFNPLKHIDPFGTLLLPGLLLLLRSSFLFGYAKPVPVNYRALRHPRRDMVLVAAAGPATNLALAVAAALAFHLVSYLPDESRQWTVQSLEHMLVFNVLLAVFNMLPIPPLDGGRVAVGLLPKFLGLPLAALEPFGLLILLVLLFFVPMLGDQMGVDLGIVSRVVNTAARQILEVIQVATGNS
jgi:Zn-dependent protease